jgi:hypothetical protein
MEFVKCHAAASSKGMRNLYFLNCCTFLATAKKKAVSELKSVSGTDQGGKTPSFRFPNTVFKTDVLDTHVPSHRLPDKTTTYRRLQTSSESVANFIHWGTTVRSQNYIHEEI